MWSSILMTLMICGAPPADAGLERARNVEPQRMTPNETMLYGYTPTRWRSWNALPATIRIEHDSETISAVPTNTTYANDIASSHSVIVGDYADSASGQAMPMSAVELNESPRRPAPQSVPPARFLDLEQPGHASTNVISSVLGKPACRANRPAVLDQFVDKQPRLLNPMFYESSRKWADD